MRAPARRELRLSCTRTSWGVLRLGVGVGNAPTKRGGCTRGASGRGRLVRAVTLPRDLGDGLVLREATPADADAIADFNADVLRAQDSAQPQATLAEWTRDLITGAHPSARASDATVVEDTRTRAIVSSMILLSHTWSYGGVRIPVGQPELVGTHAAYRGR